MRPIGIAAATAIALFAAAITPAIAEPPNDQAALSGLNEVKVAFDVTTGDGNALLKQLEVINETREALIKQGVKPHFVIAFRGPATKLVQKDQKQIKADDREYAAKIAEKVNALRSADGITSIEQCAVAVRLASTKPEDAIPRCETCGNGWISLMAYQAKGYGYSAP